MNPQLISFENQEYDINSLFNFQYNFDPLKFLMMAVIKSQKQSSQKITEFEGLISEKEDRIQELEKQTNNQDIFLSSKYKNFFASKNEVGGMGTGKERVIKITFEYKKLFRIFCFKFK